jgi:hypothetical protein
MHLAMRRHKSIAKVAMRVAACCCLRRFGQQVTQQRIPLLTDVSQPLLARTGIFAGDHPQIRADLFATVEPLRRSDDQDIRKSRNRAHPRNNSNSSRRRRLAQGASASFSNSARPCWLHSFDFQRLPSFMANACS